MILFYLSLLFFTAALVAVAFALGFHIRGWPGRGVDAIVILNLLWAGTLLFYGKELTPVAQILMAAVVVICGIWQGAYWLGNFLEKRRWAGRIIFIYWLVAYMGVVAVLQTFQ